MRVVCIALAFVFSALSANAQTAMPGFFAFVLLGEGERRPAGADGAQRR